MFNRDNSQPIFCVLFAYLTDVDIDSGAHQYFKHTHDRSKFEEYYPELNSDEFFVLPFLFYRMRVTVFIHLYSLL